MIRSFKSIIRRHWPRLRLRTILLLTFVFVAALPGFGALFLRVYENSLVRRTEAELVAQGAALAAVAGVEWPGGRARALSGPPNSQPQSVDLRSTRILPERPEPRPSTRVADRTVLAWGDRLRPVLQLTSRTTLASILLLDRTGRILVGPQVSASHAGLLEVQSALRGQAATTLRRNDTYRQHYPFEWLSRASNLRIHHARPIVANGQVVGVLLLSRSPRVLFAGIYEDRGKIVLGIVLIFMTLVILSGLLSRGIVRPVEALGEATRAVASGGGSVPAAPTTAAIEIQALYRDFGTMAEAIDRRSRYLRDFAHAVSHEFKTPLAGIGGAVELLQDHPDMGTADRDRFLGNIGMDAARLNQLVSRLLDLARADMAEMVDGVAADASDVIFRVTDAFNTAGFAVVPALVDGLPSVTVPPAVLETVLTGLLENSRQAGASRVSITAQASDELLKIAIRDNGPGIPAGDRSRIFEPFFTSRRTSGGTGLGLPIIRSLLQAHRGTIMLDGECERGAAFFVTLPA
jgi:signal transduction histidine kinase